MTKQEQRMKALDAANEIRFARSKLRREVKAGTTDPLALLVDPPDCILKVRIHDFLKWIPYVGTRRVRRFTKGVILTTDPPIGVLSVQTRQVIYDNIADWRDETSRKRLVGVKASVAQQAPEPVPA